MKLQKKFTKFKARYKFQFINAGVSEKIHSKAMN
jgi:hypothetical protein